MKMPTGKYPSKATVFKGLFRTKKDLTKFRKGVTIVTEYPGKACKYL